jgi:predicted HTH domain antitoxin
MIIEISDHTLDKLSISREEVKLEVAVALYAREILTLEQASKMADLDQLKFQQVLGERKIPIHYGQEDFEEDLKTLSQLGRI